jgi:ribokinase
VSKVYEFASIGNANIDLTFRVKELPPVDAIAQAAEGYISTGGSASNYAYAASKMGAHAYFFGVVGDDLFGRFFLEQLSGMGVDTRFVRVVPHKTTGMVTIWLDASGEKRGVALRGANSYLEPRPEWAVLNQMRLVHLAGCAPHIAEWVWKNIGTQKSFDPGSSIHLYSRQQIIDGLTHSRVTYLSTDALKTLGLGEHDLRLIAASTTNLIVVKTGAGGVRVYDGSRVVRVPALKVGVVDTTGAGDVFSAVFDFKVVAGETPEEAALWATAAAALKITKLGAKEGVPSVGELREFVDSVRSNVRPLTEPV